MPDLVPDEVPVAAAAQGRRDRSPLRGVIGYLLVGGVAFALDYGTLRALVEWARWPVPAATLAAFAVGLVVSYVLQRSVFNAGAPVGRSFLRYCVLLAVNSVAVTAIVSFFEWSGPGYTVGKIVATAATTTWNYVAYRSWVYADESR